jgi:hypothetical protein
MQKVTKNSADPSPAGSNTVEEERLLGVFSGYATMGIRNKRNCN